MKIVLIIFSILLVVWQVVSLMSEQVKTELSERKIDMNLATSIKIMNWVKDSKGYVFQLKIIKNDPLSEISVLTCDTLDKDKVVIGDIEYKFKIMKSEYKNILIKQDTDNVKYLDCSFL